MLSLFFHELAASLGETNLASRLHLFFPKE
nr:MAG TPA: hypothetical protein [Crassvirales sp.]